jgi:hypothetical protein
MRRAKNSAHLEHAMLAAAVGIIAFIIIFGGPRSHLIGPEGGIAADLARSSHITSATGATRSADFSTSFVLTRSRDPKPTTGASD